MGEFEKQLWQQPQCPQRAVDGKNDDSKQCALQCQTFVGCADGPGPGVAGGVVQLVGIYYYYNGVNVHSGPFSVHYTTAHCTCPGTERERERESARAHGCFCNNLLVFCVLCTRERGVLPSSWIWHRRNGILLLHAVVTQLHGKYGSVLQSTRASWRLDRMLGIEVATK